MGCQNSIYGCNCDEQNSCKCISANQPLKINVAYTPATYPCHSCEGTYTVNYYVNGVLMDTHSNADYTLLPQQFLFQTDTEGDYVLKIEFSNCCGPCSFSQTIHVGPPLIITRESCLNYNLTDYYTPQFIIDNPSATIRLVMTLKDVNGNVLATNTFDGWEGGVIPFSVMADGIYRVEINIEQLVGESYESILDSEFVLFDFCSILQCMKTMIMNIACQKPGQCFSQNDINLIGKLMAVVANFMSYVAGQYIVYSDSFGLLYFNSAYLTLLNNMNKSLENITIICNNCGVKTFFNAGNCVGCGNNGNQGFWKNWVCPGIQGNVNGINPTHEQCFDCD